MEPREPAQQRLPGPPGRVVHGADAEDEGAALIIIIIIIILLIISATV